jgi:hypothetical protein
MAIRCIKDLAGQISSKSKVPRFSSESSSEFQPIEVLCFLFKFHFKSVKVSIRKVVPYLKPFPSIFYLELL